MSVTATREGLTIYLADRTGLSKAKVGAVVDAFVEAIEHGIHELAEDPGAGNSKLRVSGLGSFEVRHRPARKGRNPRTGETIEIPPSTALKFKPAKNLREAIGG